MPEFDNRTVLVTGASGALGAAVVDAFLSRGATVVGVARSVREKKGQERFHALQADLTQADAARAAVGQALRKAGKIDVFVHVMGGFAGGDPVAETDESTWDQMMQLNLRSAFLVTRAVLRSMLEAGYGRIVAVGAKAGAQASAGTGAYNASKAGLHSLIQTLAEEVGDKGITANVVMPSVIDTPANRKAMPDADPSEWVDPAAIAEHIVWLCGEGAADINGALIPVYGRA